MYSVLYDILFVSVLFLYFKNEQYDRRLEMNKCIYTKKDDTLASFNSAEHIFPKCIGGQCCLPKGMVSDQINNEFSKIEMSFARENPIICLPRMFYNKTGRKKHQNRDKISVFNDINSDKIELGYFVEGKPICLDQIILSNVTEKSIENLITCHVILSPSIEISNNEKIAILFKKLSLYNSCPVAIKDKRIPQNTYLLGYKDNKWFLGINDQENAELVKPTIEKAIKKIVSNQDSILCKSDNIQLSQSHISAHFSYGISLIDVMRVYAKIAFNSFAALNSHEYILSSEFDTIRNAICTGESILEIAGFCTERIDLKPIFDKFKDQVTLGEQFHLVVFVTKDNFLYAFVYLYGFDIPVQVKIGSCNKHYTDIFICDWQNKKDYKLTDYIIEVCNSNHLNDLC